MASATDKTEEIERACTLPDWEQVVFNGGPPCFLIECGKFCFRAERWHEHPGTHRFVSILDFYRGVMLGRAK